MLLRESGQVRPGLLRKADLTDSSTAGLSTLLHKTLFPIMCVEKTMVVIRTVRPKLSSFMQPTTRI